MKLIIKDYRVYHVSKKLSKPLPNAVYQLEYIEHILLELKTETHIGIGMAYTFHPIQAEAMKLLVEGYCKTLIGKSAEKVRKYWNEAQQIMGGCGQTGLALSAYSAVDTALWDIISRDAKKPLYQLLGAKTDQVRVYGSGGWLVPVEEMIEEALQFQREGYHSYKLKLGFPDWREDIKRLERLRMSVGDSFEIMVDVNQGWDVKKTLEVIPELESLGITYLEEPLHCQDYKGNAELTARSKINICSGECLFGSRELFELLRLNGADIINPDLMRCGGITEYIQICAMAGVYRTPVTAHVLMEVSAHVLAASATGYLVENIPDWWKGIFEEAPVVKDGYLKLSDLPGLGIRFDHDYIEQHQYA